ncbi:Uncharacterised protein [uncultured Clostridium sp.]|uniref:hypothetical protein n=1 Tax=uncultured Clostridium sp. TaxID=59620 RepID=UPI000822DD32|nr:hypothetical protein [uncultured Clostridium sp.]SCJ41225.1 Uncharacterised protein [uncultured Clostridium sp.]
MEKVTEYIFNNKFIRYILKTLNLNKEDKFEILQDVLLAVVVNSIFILLTMINPFKIINLILIILYFYYLYKKNNDVVLINVIIFYFLSTFLIENIWYATHINVNINAIYLKPLLLILLTLKYFKVNKDIKEIVKDPILIIVFITILINLINVFKRGYNLNDLANGFLWYLLIYIFYLMAIKGKIHFKSIYIMLLMIQLPLVLFELIIYKDQDQITGSFGLHATNWSMIVISIAIYYFFSLYLQKKAKIKSFIIILIYCFSIFMFNETKMAFFVIPICLLIMLLISDIKVKNKIKIVSVILSVVLIGMIGIIKLYPSFTNILFNPKMLMDYAFNQHSGIYEKSRVENFEYSNEVLLPRLEDKLIGLGHGRALPNEDFSIEMYKRERNFEGEKKSQIYSDNLESGYVQNSLNIMYVESGILGVILYFIIIVIMLYRSFKIFRLTSKFEDKAIAITYFMYVITTLAIIWYANIVYILNSRMIFLIFSGIISSKYFTLNNVEK